MGSGLYQKLYHSGLSKIPARTVGPGRDNNYIAILVGRLMM